MRMYLRLHIDLEELTVIKAWKQPIKNSKVQKGWSYGNSNLDVSLNHFVIEFLKNWSELAQNWLGIFINIFSE